MLEFFQAAFQPMNIVLSVLMILIAFYWVTVVLGALDMDFLDFDVDVDADVDIDVDVDVDMDVDADVDADMDTDLDGGGGVGILAMLGWFNLGKVPFMIFLSIVIFTMWMSSILVNHYAENTTTWIALLLYVPIFLFALFIAKMVTTPMVPLFEKLNFKGEKSVDLEGRVCTVMLSLKDKKMGQGELFVGDKNFLISIVSIDGVPIKKGEQVVIVEKKEDYYLVDRMEDRIES